MFKNDRRFVGLKKDGRYCLCGVFKDDSSFRYENVDYDEARAFAQKVKQAVIYDDKGRRFYEYFAIDKDS